MSLDTANALSYSDIILNFLVIGIHPGTGLEFAGL